MATAGTNGRAERVTKATKAVRDAVAAASAAANEADRVFAQPRDRVDDFSFNSEVTAVFDDMLDRSVPFYREIQRMVAELVADFAEPGTNVYDLGCSTCNSFLNIDRVMKPDAGVSFVGVDNSDEMLAKARTKLDAARFARPYSLQVGDLDAGVEVQNASVVMLV